MNLPLHQHTGGSVRRPGATPWSALAAALLAVLPATASASLSDAPPRVSFLCIEPGGDTPQEPTARCPPDYQWILHWQDDGAEQCTIELEEGGQPLWDSDYQRCESRFCPEGDACFCFPDRSEESYATLVDISPPPAPCREAHLCYTTRFVNRESKFDLVMYGGHFFPIGDSIYFKTELTYIVDCPDGHGVAGDMSDTFETAKSCPPPMPVPTTSELGLIVLALGLATCGLAMQRRKLRAPEQP